MLVNYELPPLDNLADVQAFVNSMVNERKYKRPQHYPIPRTQVPANGSFEREIKISTEGPFLSLGIVAQFDFDGNDIPQIFLNIRDGSNQNKSLTYGAIPLNLIASNGKTGNQLFFPFQMIHLFKTNGSIFFEFMNEGAQASNVELALVGYQFTVKETV